MTNVLFEVISTVFQFHGCKDVQLNWLFCSRRDKPAASYAEVITDYDPSDEMSVDTQLCIDELFTADEAQMLLRYLNEHHRDGSTHRQRPAKLPIPMNTIGLSAIPAGGCQDFYMLHKEDDYDLPFEVWGYYDLRGYEPIPGQEEKRRRAFARGTLFIKTEGGKLTVTSGADVPGFHHETEAV